ncbi:MAG: YfcC family protein [Longimicrobiales bacterium]
MTMRFSFPHPMTLLVACIAIAAALTWVIPAGEFARQEDPASGRSVVVPGSYHAVAATPVGPFEMLIALPRGMVEAAEVIFLVFMTGGAFTVVDRTGTIRGLLERLVRSLGKHEMLVIPIASIAFAAGGALFNMSEEIIALVPVLVLITAGLGLDAVVAVSMSIGAAAVGSAFSPINPFQVGIAQKIAQVPLLSGSSYRIVLLTVALTFWILGTMRYARKTRVEPALTSHETERVDATSADGTRHVVILLMVLATFGTYVYGTLKLDWGFNQMSGIFFLMGVLAGLVGGLGVDGTAKAYVDGFRDMAFAGLLIGFARAIFVVLNDGHIIDTIVNGAFQPLSGLPGTASALGMMGVQALIHVPVPSVSGQAVLTMPILAPLSDLIGVSRQITVLAYQIGGGLCDLLTPTNGSLMAVLAATTIRYDRWLRFAVPMWLMLMAIGGVAIVLAGAIGYH